MHLSMHTALQYLSLCLLYGFDFRKRNRLLSKRASCVDVLMAFLANGHGFSLHRYHSLYPDRFFSAWVLMQVFHCSHMMHLYTFRMTTEFTRICQEPLYKFCSVPCVEFQ